jgi:hypothetical protein
MGVMGLFKRTPNTIEPVLTHLDVAWFRTWTDGIIRESGVDPTNIAVDCRKFDPRRWERHDG